MTGAFLKIISFYLFLCCVLTLFSTSVLGQQISNARLIYDPEANNFAMSGVGGGNLYEFNARNSSASGQVTIDWNIPLGRGYSEDIRTLTTVIKYNPFIKANFIGGDTVEMQKIAFVDNEFQFMLGVRHSWLNKFGEDGNSKFLKSIFLDFSTAPYKINPSQFNNSGFRNFNINIGGQFGYLTNSDFGLFGVTLNPQFNAVFIYDDKPDDRAFEELSGLLPTSQKLARNYFGFGCKLVIYLNDFSIFFETRKYFSKKDLPPTPNLSDRAIFSIGGVATGTVFRNKGNGL